MLLLIGTVDAGVDWRDRLVRALSPSLPGRSPALAASFDIWVTPPEYTGLAPQFLRPGMTETIRIPTQSALLAQLHGEGGRAVGHEQCRCVLHAASLFTPWQGINIDSLSRLTRFSIQSATLLFFTWVTVHR